MCKEKKRFLFIYIYIGPTWFALGPMVKFLKHAEIGARWYKCINLDHDDGSDKPDDVKMV